MGESQPFDPRFDTVIDRRGTNCDKWDSMEARYGVSAHGGLAMWVADMDFRPPQVVQDEVAAYVGHGVFGYYGDDTEYRDAIRWWMRNRHNWTIERDHIFSTNGMVNAVALGLETFSEPGDGVVVFSPVYHAFGRVIRAAGRELIECPLEEENGRYRMAFERYDSQITDRTRIIILCSPHNPGGQVWTRDELSALAAFAQRHDLIVISDEIHHDLVYPGFIHTPLAVAAPEIADRLLMMTASTKTFNIAGAHIGNVIIADPDLRTRFAARTKGLASSPNAFGLHMARAAYSPEGALWIDDLMAYLNGNRQLFDAGVNAIPGVRSMRLEGTYLAWVDFVGTGMPRAEITSRIQEHARIAASHGPTFGCGGESWMRFNLGLPRTQIAEAVERLQSAFGDLQ